MFNYSFCKYSSILYHIVVQPMFFYFFKNYPKVDHLQFYINMLPLYHNSLKASRSIFIPSVAADDATCQFAIQLIV